MIRVAAIREGAAVAAVRVNCPLNLHLGRPCRCQGGIDVLDCVLGNATQRSGRVRGAPQKRGISVFRAGWVAGGCVSRASLAWEAGRWVFALAGHAFTLARACDAGIGNERGLKRRLSISPRHTIKSYQTWPRLKKRESGGQARSSQRGGQARGAS